MIAFFHAYLEYCCIITNTVDIFSVCPLNYDYCIDVCIHYKISTIVILPPVYVG